MLLSLIFLSCSHIWSMERESMIWRVSQDAEKEPMHIQTVDMHVHTCILQRNLEAWRDDSKSNEHKACNNVFLLKTSEFSIKHVLYASVCSIYFRFWSVCCPHFVLETVLFYTSITMDFRYYEFYMAIRPAIGKKAWWLLLR